MLVPREFVRTATLALAALALTRAASAQVPVLGRWQDFAYSAEAVETESAEDYRERLGTLRAAGKLDDDSQLLQRIRRISSGLIAQALTLKREARSWFWELHATSDGNCEAEGMAGGKLLFGSAYVDGLHLTDGELATLIAHEIAHAIAEHQREELSEIFYLNNASLPLSVKTAAARLASSWSARLAVSRLSRIQESEADQLGMILVHQAGWPTQSMVSFYRKLSQNDSGPDLSRAYPSAASRLSMARTMARLFEAQGRSRAPRRGI